MQVIRRGDRRPFYAPAKYVVELRPEELEALRRRHNAEVAQAAASLSSPESVSLSNGAAVRMRGRREMSTFTPTSRKAEARSAEGHHHDEDNDDNRRSSANFGPVSPMEHVFANAKFQVS